MKRSEGRVLVQGTAIALGIWALGTYARDFSTTTPMPLVGSGPSVYPVAVPRNNGLPEYRPSEAADVYALLLSGSNAERFVRELDALSFHLSHMIPGEHIIVLDEGRGYAGYTPNGRADHETIGKALSLLREATGPEDGLIVHVSDHGHEIAGKGYMNLPDGEMPMDEFADLVKSVPASVFLTTSMCYGGHLAEAVAGERRTAIASCQSYQTSSSTEDASFSRWLYGAFFDEQADRNHDSRVSIFDAFVYAEMHDTFVKNGSQDPVLKGDDLPWFPSPYLGKSLEFPQKETLPSMGLFENK